MRNALDRRATEDAQLSGTDMANDMHSGYSALPTDSSMKATCRDAAEDWAQSLDEEEQHECNELLVEAYANEMFETADQVYSELVGG